MVMMMGIASAELIITPTTIDLTTKAGVEKNFGLTLTNNLSFKLVDFAFSNSEGWTIPTIILEPNETKTINIKVKKEESGLYNLNSIVSFKYLVELPEGTQTHNIEITDMGYEPSFLAIRQGDKIIWKNLDTISHSITSSKFDYTLTPNQTQEIIFSEQEIINYQDLILFYGGTLEVLSRNSEEKVHNPDYDKVIRINLDVTLDPTTLGIENEQDNYTIDATGSVEGLLKIENIGDITAQRVELSSEPNWIRFDENSFSLDINQKNFVTYYIEPAIFETEETDKNHTITLKIKGSNTEEYIQEINIFVPYSDVFDDINTNEGFLMFFTRFCKQNPNIMICNNTIQEGGGNVVIDSVVPINITEREVFAMLKRIQRIEDSNDRTNNELKKLADELGLTLPEVMNMLNQSVSMQQENERSSIVAQRGFWLFMGFIGFIGLMVALFFGVKKYMYKKRIANGGIEIRRW